MRYNNIELEVLIKGRPISEYPHNGQVYVEGRDKSEFSLRVTNHTGSRIEAVISVDGLSVVDGKEAGPASAGYVIDARGSITIPGWKLSDAEVASFVFGGKGQSYAAVGQSGSVRNTGVIGVMAFKERVQNRYDRPIYAQPFNSNMRTFAPTSDASGGWGQVTTSIGGIVPDPYLTGGTFETYGVSNCMAASGPIDWLGQEQERGMPKTLGMAAVNTFASTLGAAIDGGSRSGNVQAMGAASASASTRSRGMTKSAVRHEPEPVVQQNLGTGFGRASDFATTTIDFQRGDMVAMVVIRYDDARGLRSRGIVIDRRAKVQRNQEANPFPAMGCAPPPGWRG